MSWELTFMEWANGWWSSSALDQVIPWITHLGSHYAVAVFIILSGVVTKQKKLFFRLLLLYATQSVTVYSLKFLIRRQRPFPFLEMASKISRGPGEILDPSFPSAHTLYAIMMATLLATWFPRYRIIFYVAAGFVGWTRIYLGVHYPTDVIAGGVLGYAVTRLLVHCVDLRLEKRVD